MNVEQARFNMIEQQIRPWDVLDGGVLSLLALIKREDFVPPAYRALAFVDCEVPLGEGQAMLAPCVEARLLQAAQVHRHETVLEIGAGSGFMAALLAHRARSVMSLEIRSKLAQTAMDNLRRAGIANATVRRGDGVNGLPSQAPFDVIMLSGSVAAVPQALLDQLKPGGRLLAITGAEPVMQAVRITRLAERDFASQRTAAPGVARGAFTTQILFDTVAQRLDGFGEPDAFRF